MSDAPNTQATGLPRITFTQIPNVFFDEMLPTLKEAELKVMLYLMRRIYGWQGKESDKVSLRQICEGIVREDGSHQNLGTGMQRKAAMGALESLEGRGLVEITRSKAPDGSNCVNEYRLRLTESERHRGGVFRNPGGVGSLGTPQKKPSITTLSQDVRDVESAMGSSREESNTKAKDSSEITGYGPVTSDCSLDPVAEKKRLKAEKAAQDVARMKVQKADLQEVLDCMTDEHRALWDRMIVGMQDTLHDGKPLSFAKELGQAMIHRAQLAKCGLECWLDCCEISCEKGVFTAEFARGCVKNWKPGRGAGNGYAGGNGRGVDSNYQAGNAPPRDPSQPETFERAYARVAGPMPEVTEDNPWGAAMWEKEMWLWAEREYGYEKSHAEYDRRGFGIEYPRQ